MLQFGNKEFRNLQEQVFKNMSDIQDMMQGTTVLADFGIKVVGQVEDASELPDPSTYEGEYGDAYIVGTEEPYEYYIFTRAFEGQDEPQWFDLGIFPQPGPQGEQGEAGHTPVVTAVAAAQSIQPSASAYATVVNVGTEIDPKFSFLFSIPKGQKGDQGVQGIQGPQGPQGVKGNTGDKGEKGDPGYLYTIIDQVDTSSELPDPSTVRRDAAFLVGYQEPYDVYVIIGTDNLEWISLGQIATVEPQVYVAADVYATSGTLNSSDLASILASTDMHYIRDGSILFQRASVVNGVGYYTNIGIDTGSGATEVGYFALDLSDGTWEVSANVLPTDVSDYVTKQTDQTITGLKTFSNGIKIGTKKLKEDVGYFAFRNNADTLNAFLIGDTVALTKNLTPIANNSQDIGTNTYRYKDAYFAGVADFTGTISGTSNSAITTIRPTYIAIEKTGTGGGSTINFNADYDGNVLARGNLNLGGIIKTTDNITYGFELPDTTGFTANSKILDSVSEQTITGTKTLADASLGFANSGSNASFRISENASADLKLERSNDGTTWNTLDYIDVGGNAYLRTIMPQNTTSYSLGSTSRQWLNLYISGDIGTFAKPMGSIFMTGNLSDGLNSVSIANIAQKGTATPLTGTFSDGSFNVSKSNLTDGLYVFTYGNVEAFLFITSTMLSNIGSAPIKVPCACIFDTTGNSAMGTLVISQDPAVINSTKFTVVDDSGRKVPDGYTAYLIKTKLM